MVRSVGGSRAMGVSLVFCLIFVAASGSVTGQANGSDIEGLIPSTLVVPEGNHVQQMLLGTGVQIYVYNSTDWVLNNVSAHLYNFKGLKVGHHYFLGEVDSKGGQATWEMYETYRHSPRVTGKRLDAVAQSDSIDWMLLEATSNSGKKFFGLTRFVQRLYTQHGLPPSAEVLAKEGDVFESNYTAIYTFSAKDA